MHIPASTYRVQLSASFTLKDLRGIVPYLHRLGVSTIYASPFFSARPGSEHGYDVTNPLTINPEIGTLEEFEEVVAALKERNMNWLQDIVPNHMAFDGHNRWLWDALEHGPTSEFYQFFDINWTYHEDPYRGKVMAPFLGDELNNVLDKNELVLSYSKRGFYFKYYDHKYPASSRSYLFILSLVRQFLEARVDKNSEGLKQLDENITAFENAQQDKDRWKTLKEKFYDLFQKDEALDRAITSATETISTSRELMLELLDEQFFCLVHWKTTESKINYRRFFTINDLICLNMEKQEVFDRYHEMIRRLCNDGLVQGLRIDHIDGLFDPEGYLQMLRTAVGPEQYLIIEKILEWEETLPLRWPIQGTSGYGFLATVNHLFTDFTKEQAFNTYYREIYPELPDYEELVYEKKRFILEERMSGELDNLLLLMEDLQLVPDKKTHKQPLKEALGSFLAAFPVYRIYPREYPLTSGQTEVIKHAYQKAKDNLPAHEKTLDFLLSVFLGKAGKRAADMQYFLQRCQQFTGPLAAKGVEDTSFYIFNQLISHNEVGDSPHVFGIRAEDFHRRMLLRNKHFPHSINATSTHDTKRGEDARMRINVVSEMPEQWFAKIHEWMNTNASLKKSEKVPDSNEEYFMYQALLGAIPSNIDLDELFTERTSDYLLKVLREAKVHSSWSEPDEQYEQEVLGFAEAILKHDPFLKSFLPFVNKAIHFGALYSLGQCLVKITAPGIPDIYQGTELWDLSYVDPDNRRPVDYGLRASLLQQMEEGNRKYIDMLTNHLQDGRIKMYTIFKALQERRANEKVFREGEYIPLESAENALCYARVNDEAWYIIMVPKLLTAICNDNQLPVGDVIWKDMSIALPDEFPQRWVNVFTNEEIQGDPKLYLSEALRHFPVALLKGVAI
ncbi:Malto-oligosyltrehalose synthase [Fulvivirga imtechensis AK7]|uniref:Malto-oligosyltrehalose synthase n=1 Tax=Fulvivirga imtechensis AK7 TaxID=1237149 RepID=L8JZR5_9BACT|nr:malto-oligosyltrehalose synthase [Fulvivirga imtechensis]ELR73638.1 Malto-oligosyltrehalose synthase [Fulvivirga imtechensis AK7]